MKDELQDTMARPKRYDNIDGTGEMFMGLMLLGFSLLGYLQTILPEHSMWRRGIGGLLFMYIVLIPVLGFGFVLQRVVKKRLTWPRTGYVAYHRDRKSFWAGMFGSAALGAVVAAVFSVVFVCLWVLAKYHHGAISLGRVIYLGFWAPLYAFWVFRMGREQPWKWMIVMFMVLGLVVIGLIVPGDFVKLMQPVTLFVGLMWFLSGGATLFLYLRRTQQMKKRDANER